MYGEVAELAEGTTLLTWQGVKSLGGSNPLLSAIDLAGSSYNETDKSMSTNFNCYHFVPANRLNFLEKIVNYKQFPNFKIIIDLEDSIIDINNVENTKILKSLARKHLIENASLLKGFSYFIRINTPDSIYYEEDKRVIKFFSSYKHKPMGLVISKTKSKRDLEIVNDYLEQIDFKNLILIPLIELKESIYNLEDIINYKNVSKIIFGHHDYFHDTGMFPIPDSIIDSEQYRTIVKNIFNIIDNKNIEYIDGIHPLLDDSENLKNTCDYLYNLYSNNSFGKLSVHIKQIETIVNFSPSNKKVFLNNKDTMSNNNKYLFANEIISYYENRDKNRGITKMNNRYVSPQMYLEAKKFIKEYEMESNLSS